MNVFLSKLPPNKWRPLTESPSQLELVVVDLQNSLGPGKMAFYRSDLKRYNSNSVLVKVSSGFKVLINLKNN